MRARECNSAECTHHVVYLGTRVGNVMAQSQVSLLLKDVSKSTIFISTKMELRCYCNGIVYAYTALSARARSYTARRRWNATIIRIHFSDK